MRSRISRLRGPGGSVRLAGAVAAVRPGDAAAGMRAGPAQVKTPQGGPVVAPPADRAQVEELIEGHVAVQRVSSPDAQERFEVRGREGLTRDDRPGEVGEVLAELPD